jgi:hypothetical protein
MSKETILRWAEGGLPPAYQPFQKLDLCSNRCVDTQIAMDIHGVPLLLVGVGARCPQIWLSAPVAPGSAERRYIVEGYASFVQPLTIALDEKRGWIHIKLGTISILDATQLSESSAIVEALNFEPLGLKVVGNKKGISVGTNKISGSTIGGSKVGIGLA